MASPEEKRWAKEARSHRNALKKAAPPSVPNLFVSRLSRQQKNIRPSNGGTGCLVLVLVVLGILAAYWWFKHPLSPIPPVPGPMPGESPVQSSTAAVAAASIPILSTPVPVAVSTPVVRPSPVVMVSTPSAIDVDRREWRGISSQMTEPRQVVVRGRSAWRNLWDEAGLGEAPRVNFNDHIVVGVFAGPRAEPTEIRLGAPIDTDEGQIIPYEIVSSTGVLTSANQNPYQLRVIPRTTKPVHFRQESAATKGTHP
jgi:hypothetical protein